MCQPWATKKTRFQPTFLYKVMKWQSMVEDNTLILFPAFSTNKSSWITSLIQSWLTSKCDKIYPTVILECSNYVMTSETQRGHSTWLTIIHSPKQKKIRSTKVVYSYIFDKKKHWKSCNFTQWRGLPISFIWTVRLPGHWNISVAGATVVERLLRPELGIGTWSRPVANQTWILLWYTTILE